MGALLDDIRLEFRRHKEQAERAMSELDDAGFVLAPGALVNPVALIVKHMAGNMASRWRDFLTTDGEKPTRDRDGEFVLSESDTRAALMAAWQLGWAALFDSLDHLTEADLPRTITIRGEKHTAQQALLRSLTHAAYHTGQILYLVRLLNPQAKWQTVAPGKSREHRPSYRA